jgi:hypothetical protein
MASIGDLAIATIPLLRYQEIVISPRRSRALALLVGVVLVGGALIEPVTAMAQPKPAGPVSARRDGQRDFDFEIGTWKTQLSRRLRPLTGSNEWARYSGTSVVRKVAGGRANLVELDVRGPAGRIEGMSLRLYNPESGQWSLNFASIRTGTLSEPVFGRFENGRGEFYGQESFDGRVILVRFVISDITPTSCRFEQAFSDDGGKTWEVNWIVTDTRARRDGVAR